MRQAMGVSRTTTVVAMMNELGQEPLMFCWLRMAAQVWNKALSWEVGDYLRFALEANVQLSINASCWPPWAPCWAALSQVLIRLWSDMLSYRIH
jgi:hypothetical protein